METIDKVRDTSHPMKDVVLLKSWEEMQDILPFGAV